MLSAQKVRQTMTDTLGLEVLLYPDPKPAPRHNFALVRPRLIGCTSLFNITEFLHRRTHTPQ